MTDGSEYVEVQRSSVNIRLARPTRLAIAAEVDRQDLKSRVRQHPSLLFPAFLVKAGPMSQHDTTVSLSIHVGIHNSPILCRKGNFSL